MAFVTGVEGTSNNMRAMICRVILILLIVEFVVLQAKSFYSDCTGDNTVISLFVSNCNQSRCVIEGGSPVKFELTFQARSRVRSGKAKACKSQSNVCARPVADINDICDYIKPGCPLEAGGVYTYTKNCIAPNISMKGELVYKPYDEECKVIACVRYSGEFRSDKKKISQEFFTDDSYPCRGK